VRTILSNIAHYQGVESASLVSLDGVLVLTVGSEDTQSTAVHLTDQEVTPIQTLAALASGWVNQVIRAVGQLSWNAPYRYVLKASEKTLVVHVFGSSFLLLVIEPEIDPEVTRALMDQAVQQFMGHMQLGSVHENGSQLQASASYPQGLFPTQNPPNTGALAPDGSITESAGEG
jgi:predicted regulator of Ras-like GTPase activity (Roadblock/LC7/MglB family)